MRLVLLLAISTATGCAGPAPRAIKLPSEHVSIPLELYGDRPVISATINGKGPYRFVLDTGAAVNVVDPSIVSPMRGSEATLDMDGVVLTGLPVVSMDFRQMFHDDQAPLGVLSASAFPGYLLTFNYPQKTLQLERGALPEADGRRIFDYPAGDELPTLPVTVGGREFRPHIDTGSPGNLTLTVAAATTLGVADKLSKTGQVHTPGATFDTFVAKVDGEIRIGDFTLNVDPLTFSDLNPGGRPVGNIGYQQLRRFAITLDSKNRRVRLAE